MTHWPLSDVRVRPPRRLGVRAGSRVDIMVIGARGIPDVEGGAEKQAENLFPQFAARGYRVQLVGVKDRLRQTHYQGVDLVAMPTLRFRNSEKVIYNLLACLYACRKRPRLVHLQGLNSGLFILLYKLAGLKVVMRYGSSDTEFRKWGFFGRQALRLCESQLRFADRVIVVSGHLGERVRSKCGVVRVDVIPNGVDRVDVSDEASFCWSRLGLGDAPYVLSVGRLTVDKDFETLVRAVESLEDRRVRLVVAGGADERGYAERLLARNCDRIRFIGRVDRALLGALYANCAVYVNCSRHEGLSNALLEAISHGCPIVASDIPANLEMGLDQASYFPAGEWRALAARLDSALGNGDRLIADRTRFLDWTTVRGLTVDCYQKVVPDLVQEKENAVATSARNNGASISSPHEEVSVSPE